MSAAPYLYPPDDDDHEPRLIAVPRTSLNVREIAALLGVAESTVRRVVKQGANATSTHAECSYRGLHFTASRAGHRSPWQIALVEEIAAGDDVTNDAVARVDGRIAELRVAMLPLSQEPALEHTSDRPWWKLWARG